MSTGTILTAEVFRAFVLGVGSLLALAEMPAFGMAKAQAQASVSSTMTREIGTVKAIAGNSITLATDSGQQIAVSVATGAHLLQLAPGSTNLKDAQPITLDGIAVGDRVLVTGKAGDSAGTFTALRVILMKSSAIAEKRSTEQADWQKRGMGGIVGTVDSANGTLTVLVGAKQVEVHTSSSTIFRRYAGDSVKFEDAVPSTLAQIHAGDQLRARGAKSDDGLEAEEVVSGSFKNLSGLIATLNPANGTLTLKDLATKQTMTVKVTPNSNVHTLPPEAARMFAARARGAAGTDRRQHAAQPEGARPENGMGHGLGRTANADFSQMVNKLPEETIADLKVGDAIMVVASQAETGSAQVTAVTLLSGVGPILQAAPGGSSEMTLSPWNVSGDAPDTGAQ